MIFFAYGLIGLFFPNKPSLPDTTLELNPSKLSPVEIKTIVVDIEGSVVKPGLYKLPQNSRIQDGLIAAGGLSASADRSYVAKSLNLAIKLTDGAKIYIPNVSEAVNSSSVLSGSFQAGSVGGPVNINNSLQSQLESLPGIGPVTAQKIISGRPYSSLEELLNKKIVGSKVFEQIKDKISVY